MSHLREEEINRYRDSDCEECPACEAADVRDEGDFEIDGSSVRLSRSCGQCGATWVDVFGHDDVEDFKG